MRRLRLVTGLVIACFVVPHFLNHADSLKFYEAEYANMRPMIEAMKLGK